MKGNLRQIWSMWINIQAPYWPNTALRWLWGQSLFNNADEDFIRILYQPLTALNRLEFEFRHSTTANSIQHSNSKNQILASNDFKKPWAIWLRQLLPVHKIKTFSIERVKSEFNYVADNFQNSTMWFLADANFGILPRDVEIAELEIVRSVKTMLLPVPFIIFEFSIVELRISAML